MLGQISSLHVNEEEGVKREHLEWVGNCFMELVNLIIYERTELYDGWD